MKKNLFNEYNRIFFIGVGGISMSALCQLAVHFGADCAGSDVTMSHITNNLIRIGVKVFGEHNSINIKTFKPNLVVYTGAISSENPELLLAKKLNIKCLERADFLGLVCNQFNNVIAIGGTHGKTTTSAMISEIFVEAKLNPTCHIGGEVKNFNSNLRLGDNNYFITEACEYKKNFLYLKPHVSVVLNSEPDHLECYGSAENLKNAYKNFANSAQISVAMCGDGIDCTADFGYQNTAQFYAADIKSDKGCYSFNVFNRDKKLGYIELSVYGKHNILNALAAISVAVHEGIDFENIHCGLKNFKGVERRFEQLGEVNEAKCIADYAHHPNEIKAAISSVENIYDGRLFVVFQPHTYSRTKNLFEEFVEVLSGLNNLLIYKTYSAREYFDDSGSALTLSQAIHKSKYGDDLQDIFEFISGVQRGDLVLFLGAGDIYDIAKSIIKKSNSI